MKKLFYVFCTAVTFLNLTVTGANASVIPESMKEAMQTDVAGMPSLLNLVVAMVVVIGLIYATGFIYARLSRSDKFKLGLRSAEDFEKNKFTILSSLPLGQNKNLYSVEINNKILVIGATQQNITLLKEFDKNIETEIKEVILEKTPVKKDTEPSKKIDFEDLDKNLNDISSIYKKYRS